MTLEDRIASQLAAVQAVLAEHLPADVAAERARNIVQATALGGEDLLAVAREALVGHWSLRGFALPPSLPQLVVGALVHGHVRYVP